MLERAEPLLRGLCLALAAVLLLQCGRLVLRGDPLSHLQVPALPTWEAPAQSPVAGPKTNAPAAPAVRGSHGAAVDARTAIGATNSPPVGRSPDARPRPAAASADADLPVAVRERLGRIKDSEIFGAVPRPQRQPMALLGIAGEDVFLRAPSGQTGLLRVGEQLGGARLLQIGTNRVVVEYQGQKQELTIFAGFGSRSLLPK